MNKSLRNIPGSKQRSTSSAFISLHFNKADEDQLEISYGEKADSDDNSKNDATSPKSITSNLDKLPHSQSLTNTDDKNVDSKKDDSDDGSTPKSKQNSRDSTPSRDSVVKDYWSRISKRAGSLDSDLSAPEKNIDQNEGWLFFRDIKGKLAKSLEERKQKENQIKPPVKDDKTSMDTLTVSDFDTEVDYDSDRTPTEEGKNDERLKLSPAIEVPFNDSVDTEFDNLVEGELEKAKCEILLTKSVKTSSDNVTNTSETFISEPDTKPPNENNHYPDVEPVSNSYCQTSVKNVKHYYYLVKSYWNGFISKLLVAILALCLVPVPSWFSGFIAGAFLSGYIVFLLFKPGKPKEKLIMPEFTAAFASSNIPVTEVEEPIIYKGWMNELPCDMNYNPETYHVNCTRSLYIRLDGSYLRVSYPQTNIPKRAMFNEPRFDLQFIYQQHYDITGASVELLPTGLAKKRLWSKKYPICLTIPNSKLSLLSKSEKEVDTNSSLKVSNKKDSPIKKLAPRINENNEVILYLFSRTDREKDLWYKRFRKASKIKLLKNYSPSSTPDISTYEIPTLENKRTISADLGSLQLGSMNELTVMEGNDSEVFTELSMTKQQKYDLYMSQLLAPLRSDPFLLASHLKDKKISEKKSLISNSVSGNMSWLNVFIGRVFFDFLTEDVWAQYMAEKIGKKLAKLKLPAFLTELTVKDINLGTALPKIHCASEPTIDQRGLWIDIDLSYNGSFQMTLETKINLLRYKCDPGELSITDVPKENENRLLRSPVYNSEEEDSAESSSDDDFPQPETHESSCAEESSAQMVGGSTGKKLLRLVDRFAQSTYFQHAAKNKYIKKAMEDISNTPLVLTVEVQWLAGTLAINIPPMPTDRLWYGFRTNPHLSIVARPKLGHHAVTITQITEWIEKKLVLEFQKLLVMPNMDDLIIPVMQPDSDLPKT